jgi:Zn-dependent protease with chaperone function
MALILFMLVLPVFTFLLSPLTSISSRKHEFEADAFAATHTDARDLVSALVKMYEDNASTSRPTRCTRRSTTPIRRPAVRIRHLQTGRRIMISTSAELPLAAPTARPRWAPSEAARLLHAGAGWTLKAASWRTRSSRF